MYNKLVQASAKNVNLIAVLRERNLASRAMRPALKLVIVIAADVTRAISHMLLDFTFKPSKRIGSNIVDDPIEKVSGVDHQKIKAELDKNRRPTEKDWYFDKPIFKEIK